MELITALAALTIPLLVTSGAIASLPIPTTNLPVCEYEDGSSQAACVWLPLRQGNGVGRNLINLQYGKVAIYTDTMRTVIYDDNGDVIYDSAPHEG